MREQGVERWHAFHFLFILFIGNVRGAAREADGIDCLHNCTFFKYFLIGLSNANSGTLSWQKKKKKTTQHNQALIYNDNVIGTERGITKTPQNSEKVGETGEVKSTKPCQNCYGGSNLTTLTILTSVSGLSKVMRQSAADNRDWIMSLWQFGSASVALVQRAQYATHWHYKLWCVLVWVCEFCLC